MGYVYSSFYINGNSSNCTSQTAWIPGQGPSIDYNDGKRSTISNIYYSLFGRYGEQGGVEFWLVDYATNNRSYSYMYNLIRNSASGFDRTALNGQKHTWLGAGGCPPPIIYGCTDPTANNYNPSATPGNPTSSSSCTYSVASVSLTTNTTSLILEDDGTYTLTWSISSGSTIYSRQLYLNGAFNRNLSSNYGSLTLSPTDGTDLSYQLRVTNRGGTGYSSNANIAVYVKPQVTLSTDDADNTIVQGESLNLYWVTTGDASTLTIEPGIGSSNLVSNVPISPTVTTTYIASASGSGGSGSAELTVTVLPPPSVSVNGPASADYGSSIAVTCDGTNVPTSFNVTPYYYDLDGGDAVAGDSVELPVGDNVSEDVTFDNIPWGDRGPVMIDFVVMAVGYGGLTANDIHVVSINIDQVPDLITVPESRDKIKDEDPVISPDREVELLELEVMDIDIPVEVRADRPAKVEIDDDGNYRDIRQI